MTYRLTPLGDLQIVDRNKRGRRGFDLVSGSEKESQNMQQILRLQKGSSIFEKNRGLDILLIQSGGLSKRDIVSAIRIEIAKVVDKVVNISVAQEGNALKVRIVH